MLIDHRRRQNVAPDVVETSVTQSPLFLSHFDVICHLLCTYQGLASTGGGRAYKVQGVLKRRLR